jgi:hypothetical protein
LSAAATAATAQIYPSVRGEPAASVTPPRVVERGVERPQPAGRAEIRPGDRDIPDRAILRGEAGEAVGTADVPRTGRGIARSSEGEAVGTVDPARSGGGVVRAPDGSVRGIVPGR